MSESAKSPELPFSVQLAMEADRLEAEREAAETHRCRHGQTGPHGYGMADEPDYDGGPILDILLSCWGPE